MINPFTEKYETDKTDENLIKESIQGDKKSLDSLIRRHQDWIYNIALRMVFNPEEAKDATQEILIKIITNLASFEGRSAFRTWAYRIALNHLLTMKKSKGEQSHADSFSQYAKIIDNTPDFDLPDNKSYSVDMHILVEEVKISCMFGMLLCLDREQRLVYILGALFQVTDKVGAELLNISKDNFRQKLSRARKDLFNFMDNKCGLVNENNPCRCSKKTKALIDVGYVNPSNLRFNKNYFYTVEKAVGPKLREFIDFIEKKHNEHFLSHPYAKSPDFDEFFGKIMSDKEFKNIFNLN